MKKTDIRTKTLEELFMVVENPKDYKSKVVDIAFTEIEHRTPTKGQIRTITEKIYIQKCKHLLERSLFQVNPHALPYSAFLPEKRRKSILLKELKAFKQKRKLMNDGLSDYGTSGV